MGVLVQHLLPLLQVVVSPNVLGRVIPVTTTQQGSTACNAASTTCYMRISRTEATFRLIVTASHSTICDMASFACTAPTTLSIISASKDCGYFPNALYSELDVLHVALVHSRPVLQPSEGVLNIVMQVVCETTLIQLQLQADLASQQCT